MLILKLDPQGLKVFHDRANGVHPKKPETRYQKPVQSPPRRSPQLNGNGNVHASHPRRRRGLVEFFP